MGIPPWDDFAPRTSGSCRIQAGYQQTASPRRETMAKGNNARKKETKKPKKTAVVKSVSTSSVLPKDPKKK